MEHVLSAGTLDSLTDFMHFIQRCPRTGKDWLNYFKEYRRQGLQPEKCEVCGNLFAREFEHQIKTLDESEP